MTEPSPATGTVFAIPLASGDYVLGVVLDTRRPSVRVGLIGDAVAELPSSPSSIASSDVVVVTAVAREALSGGRWPIVGVIENFDATEWPNPPMLPGENADTAQGPAALERELADFVRRRRRTRLHAVRADELIPVEQDQGRRYAELILAHGRLLSKMARETVDWDAGSFAATVAFVEMNDPRKDFDRRRWATAELAPGEAVTEMGWVRSSSAYEMGLVPTIHRFLADAGHSVVFDYQRLDLTQEGMRGVWQRIENERYGPLEIFPLQIFYRDERSMREMYAAVGGGIDEATTASVIRDTYDPVSETAFMLDVEIDRLPPHGHPVDEDELAELARHVQGLALRYTGYDGYLVWLAK